MFMPILIVAFYYLPASKPMFSKGHSQKYLSIGKFLFCVLFVIILLRVLKLPLLQFYRVAPLSYILLGIISLIGIYLSVILFNQNINYILFLTILYILSGEAVEISLMNMADLQETTLDTINIFINRSWRFSYHNPIYDILPYDSVLKVVLLDIFNLSEPAHYMPHMILNATIMILVSLIYYNIPMYIFKINNKSVGIISILFGLSIPYLQYFVPPHNFSIAFMLVFLYTMLRQILYPINKDKNIILLLSLFFLCSILSHMQSVLTLTIVMFIILINSLHKKKKSHVQKIIQKKLLMVLGLCLLIFISINLVGEILRANINYINMLARSFFSGVISAKKSVYRQTSFEQTPTILKISYPLPLFLVYSYIIALLLKILRKQSSNFPMNQNVLRAILLSILISAMLLSLLAGVTLRAYHLTRHLGTLSFLYVTLVFPFLINCILKGRKIPKIILHLLILFTMTMGIISPHKMPDQYSFSKSMRGATFEDYMLSEFVFKNIHMNQYYSTHIFELNANIKNTRGTLVMALIISHLKRIVHDSTIATSNAEWFKTYFKIFTEYEKLNLYVNSVNWFKIADWKQYVIFISTS